MKENDNGEKERKFRRRKILKLISYIGAFSLAIFVMNVYKGSMEISGTDDIAAIINTQNGLGQQDDSGIEVLDEKDTGSFYTFEKEYDLKEPEKTVVEENLKKIEMHYYKVQKTDTMLKISRKLGVNINVLVANNPQLSNGQLKVGDKLKVFSQNGIYHKVKRGETIAKIAKRYKVTKEDIASVNTLDGPKLKYGEEVFIPNPNLEILEKEKRLAQKKALQKELKLARKKLREREEKIARTLEKEEDGNRGRFMWPVSFRGIGSPFGTRFHPVYRRYIFHKGIDLRAAVGTPIYAPQDGKISFTGWMGGYGKIIIMNHEGGYTTRFGHLSEITIESGTTVSKGDLIGYTGQTGTVTGPHLHYEIRKNGVPMNPVRFH